MAKINNKKFITTCIIVISIMILFIFISLIYKTLSNPKEYIISSSDENNKDLKVSMLIVENGSAVITKNVPSTGNWEIESSCRSSNTTVYWDSINYKLAIKAGISPEECTIKFKKQSSSLNLVAMYVDGAYVDELEQNKVYRLDDYECTNDETVSWDIINRRVSIDPVNGNTTCNLYFEEITFLTLKETIIEAETPVSDIDINFANTSATNGDAGLYYTADAETYGEDGERIYYYRGDIDNNWVSFGGYYWRIVRTTAEGGVKLVYSGGNPVTGPSSLTTSSGFINNGTKYSFNASSNLKYYVGYTYNTSSYSGTQTNSNAKTIVDNWYTAGTTTLTNTDKTYLSETSLFCADKSVEKVNGTRFTYPARDRAIEKRPTFVCNKTNNGRYTVTANNTNGNNGYLTYPIGLLSLDEIYYAGAVYYQNGTSLTPYIFDNTTGVTTWWTISPCGFYEGNAGGWYVSSSGYVNNDGGDIATTRALRPAVALKSCVTVTGGNGSKETPYTLSNLSCQ